MIEQILDVRAYFGVHGDAAATSYIADDFISRNRVATLGPEYHQVVLAAHLESGFADPEHSFDGGDQPRRGLFGGGIGFRRRDRFAERIG